MIKSSSLNRVHRHLRTNLRLLGYRRRTGTSPLRQAATPVIDPHVHQLLRAIRGIRRRHDTHTRALPSMRD